MAAVWGETCCHCDHCASTLDSWRQSSQESFIGIDWDICLCTLLSGNQRDRLAFCRRPDIHVHCELPAPQQPEHFNLISIRQSCARTSFCTVQSPTRVF